MSDFLNSSMALHEKQDKSGNMTKISMPTVTLRHLYYIVGGLIFALIGVYGCSLYLNVDFLDFLKKFVSLFEFSLIHIVIVVIYLFFATINEAVSIIVDIIATVIELIEYII